jgi:hypothetical protein
VSINYDPDAKPHASREMFEEADLLGLEIVNVICDEQGAKVGDATGVSFAAMTAFLPRAGDRISLKDGTVCEVKRVHFNLSQRNDDQGRMQSLALVPNVVAYKIKGSS